jgi:SAM-dependent methyltransferase
MQAQEYITEIDYLHGFFTELSVPRLKLALLARGIAHSVGNEPAYLELGYGQGLSLNIHAAAMSGSYAGTDFNSAHAANAKRLADSSGKHVAIFEDSFEELAARTDLPLFDIIVLHGIWSWVSDASRAAILDLARNRLKPGGILYVSYNSIPGWSPTLPLRHLLNEYARRAATGGILAKVEQSIGFVERVINAGALYFQANPSLAGRLAAIREQDRSYVSHEYFNQHWQPMSFSDVADRMAEAKLGYAASANLVENIEGVFINPETLAILDSIPDETLRETVRDYFINQQFRRDIYVKGGRRMTPAEILEEVADLPFLLLDASVTPPQKVRTPLGEADLKAEVYGPLTAAIAAAEGPFTHRQLASGASLSGLTAWQLWEALLILTAAGHLAPAAQSTTPDQDSAASRKLNRAICDRARYSAGMQTLAAPAIGSGIPLGRIEQLFLLALADGAEDAVSQVWNTLMSQGQRLVVDQKTIEDPEENKRELHRMLANFNNCHWPVLRSVGAVGPDGLL